MTVQNPTFFNSFKRATVSTCNMVAEAAETLETIAQTGKVYATDLKLDAESSSRINELERKEREKQLAPRPKSSKSTK